MLLKLQIQTLLLSGLFLAVPAEAFIVLQQASIPVNIDYDTNLNLSQEKTGVWRYTSNPNYSITAQDERNRWFTNLGLILQKSSNSNISADREDPNLNIGWQRDFEKGSFSLNARYDKRSSRFAQFNNNALLDIDGTSVSKSFNASFIHEVTERLKLTLGADYSKNTFSDSSFVDSISKSINASASYELTEKISPFLQLSYTDFQPKGSLTLINQSNQSNIFNQFNFNNQSSTSKNFLVGTTVLISPRLTFSPSVGINSVSTSGSGWIANTSLNYLSERENYVLLLSRSVTPGGLGDFQKTDTLSFGYNYDLSNKSSVGANFNLSKSQSQFDSETTQLTGFYTRELSMAWQLRFIAGYREQKQSIGSTDNKNLGLSLIYNIPQF